MREAAFNNEQNSFQAHDFMSAPAAQDAPPYGDPQTEARVSLRTLFHQGDQ
ncbi:hypothetical protein Thiosp_03692 [Thiorhodovibrio litoralis]|nr:hypothetical protein Thiosp_03692 [Thiorhodovibrio litoralis]